MTGCGASGVDDDLRYEQREVEERMSRESHDASRVVGAVDAGDEEAGALQSRGGAASLSPNRQ